LPVVGATLRVAPTILDHRLIGIIDQYTLT
jgi:hypothetical protein